MIDNRSLITEAQHDGPTMCVLPHADPRKLYRNLGNIDCMLDQIELWPLSPTRQDHLQSWYVSGGLQTTVKHTWIVKNSPQLFRSSCGVFNYGKARRSGRSIVMVHWDLQESAMHV